MGISRDKLDGRIRSHERKSSWFRIWAYMGGHLKGTTVAFDEFRSTLTTKIEKVTIELKPEEPWWNCEPALQPKGQVR
jgi:hypothetical protein